MIFNEFPYMNSLFDRYLLFRLKTKHDQEAFARLYDRYVESIYRFVFLKLPSREMAEDVAAETFLKCWQYIQNQHTVGNIRALLYRIARNLVVDIYRKTNPNHALDVSVTFEPAVASSDIEGEAVTGGIFSDNQQGRMLIEARADIALIVKKMARLKEDYRDVLTLRLIDDLSFGDIAQILEKSPGNIRVIYHRAMKALGALDTDSKSNSLEGKGIEMESETDILTLT